MLEVPKIIMTDIDGSNVHQEDVEHGDWALLISSTEDLKQIEVIVLNKIEQGNKTRRDFIDEVLTLIESRLPSNHKGFIEHWNNLNEVSDINNITGNSKEFSIAGYVEPNKWNFSQNGNEGVHILTLKLIDENVSLDNIQSEVKELYKQTLNQIVEIEIEQKENHEYNKDVSKYHGVGNSDFISHKKKFN